MVVMGHVVWIHKVRTHSVAGVRVGTKACHRT